jgi:hypothetical protein
MAAWLVPFVTGLIKGFVAEYNRPPTQAGTAPAPCAVVDSGRVNNMVWAAVPYEYASSLKAAYPGAYPVDTFFRTLAKRQFSEPEGWRLLQPFAEEVMAAVRQYADSCQIFVMYVGG